jgi:hypothetical protein
MKKLRQSARKSATEYSPSCSPMVAVAGHPEPVCRLLPACSWFGTETSIQTQAPATNPKIAVIRPDQLVIRCFYSSAC